MFSRLCEPRFPKERTVTQPGPGSYEVRSCLDESTATISARDRLEDVSVCLSIFDEEVDPKTRTPRDRTNLMTPRRANEKETGSRQLPFGRAKENIQTPNFSTRRKSLGNQSSRASDDGKPDTTVSKKAKPQIKKLDMDSLKDRRIADLQNRVEELESVCTENENLRRANEGLRTENHQHKKTLEVYQELEGGNVDKGAPGALAELVADLVAHELETPRQVLCLHQEQLKREAARQAKQVEECEKQSARMKQTAKQVREERASRAKELASAREEAAKEVAAAREETARLQEELDSQKPLRNGLEKQIEDLCSDLGFAQLEVRRLQEEVTKSQEALDKHMEREAKMAGHANHKQKIHLTMELKKENVALRDELHRVKQQLHRAVASSPGRIAAAAPASGWVCPTSLPLPERNSTGSIQASPSSPEFDGVDAILDDMAAEVAAEVVNVATTIDAETAAEIGHHASTVEETSSAPEDALAQFEDVY